MANNAAYLTAFKQKLEVGDAEIPKPGPDEIVVKNDSIAVNPADYKVQDGMPYFKDSDFPTVLGLDVAGVVHAVGPNITKFKAGDRVLAIAPILVTKRAANGGFQQYTLTYANGASRIPDALDSDAASTVALAIATAAYGLFHKDFLNLPRPSGNPELPKQTGQDILILGGASSVGQYAIQLASQAGLTVYTTASPKNNDFLITLGASQVFDYRSSTLIEDVKKAAPKLSLVYDAISEGASQEQAVGVLQTGGQIVTVLDYTIQLPSNVKASMVFAALLATPGNELGAWLFGEYVEKALESGRLVPNRVEKRPGGLAALEAVLDEYRTKGISGAKFVLNP